MSIYGERQSKLASLFHQQCLKPLVYRKHGTTWNYRNASDDELTQAFLKDGIIITFKKP